MDIESAAVQQEQSKLQLEETQVTLSKPVINDSANSNTNVSQAITQVSKSIKKKKTKKKLRALQAYKPIFAMIEEQLVFLLKGNILLELNRNSDDQDYVPIGFKLNPQNRWNPIQRVIEHTKHQCIEIQVDNALKPIEDFKFIIKVLCSYGDSQYHDIALSLEKYQAIIESTKQIESQQGEYIKGMQQQMLLQQQQQQQESSQDQSQLYEKPNTELRELTPNHSLLFHSYSQNDLNLSEMLFSPSENSQGIQQTLGYLIGNESFKEHTGYYQNSDNDFGQYIQEQVFFESDEQQSNNIHSSINKQHGEQYKSQQSVPESINIGNSNNNNNTHSYEIPQQQQSLNNNSANMSFYKQFLENQSKNSSNINGKTTATNPLLNKTSKPSPTIEEYEKAFYDQFYLRAMDVLGSMNKGKEQLFFAFTMGKFDKFGFFESMYNFGVNKNFMILLGSEMNSMSNVFMRNGWLEIFDHQTRISNSLNFITLINREYEQHMSQMKNNQSLLMQQMQKNDKNMHGSNTNEQQNTQTKSNAQSKNDPLQEHISESVDIVVNTFDQIKIPAKLSIHDIKVQQFGLRITQIDISPTMIQQVHAIRQKQLASQSHPNYIQMFDRTLTYTQESQAFLEKFYPQKKNKNYKDINELPEVRESIEEMRCGFRQLLSM